MALFAPGVAQGVLQAQDAMRQQAEQAQLMAQRKQVMQYQAWQMNQAKQAESDRMRYVQQAGQMLTPPPVAPQTPSPGQSSQPMQPPGMQPPGMQPPGMGQPQAPQMVTPGMQQTMGQAKPPIPPYRSLNGQPQGMPQPNPQATPPGAPPPVGDTAPKQSPVGMLEQMIAKMDAQGIPPEDRVGVLTQLSPFLKDAASEELMRMREQGMQMTGQMKELKFLLDQEAEARKGAKDLRQGDQADQRIAQGAERLELLKKKASAGVASGASSGLTDAGMKLAEEFIRNGLPLPGGWSKQGMSRGNAILNRMAEDEAGGAGSGTVATDRATVKSEGAALTQNTKDVAVIEPYNQMVKTNGNVLKGLAEKATLTGSPWANQSINYLKTHPSSDPDQTKFLAQMLVFQSEAARVISNPRLVGALTDSARQELQHIVNGDMSASTIGSVVDLLVADGDRRVAALKQQGASVKSNLKSAGSGGKGAENDPLGIR